MVVDCPYDSTLNGAVSAPSPAELVNLAFTHKDALVNPLPQLTLPPQEINTELELALLTVNPLEPPKQLQDCPSQLPLLLGQPVTVIPVTTEAVPNPVAPEKLTLVVLQLLPM
jgi:hypothetical protein